MIESPLEPCHPPFMIIIVEQNMINYTTASDIKLFINRSISNITISRLQSLHQTVLFSLEPNHNGLTVLILFYFIFFKYRRRDSSYKSCDY